MLDKKFKIAILMSTYNGVKYIRKQLSSIENQNGVDITLFIRDDGSTDGTNTVINDFSNVLDIKRINNEGENLGAARSFWKLIKNVKLDYDFYAFADQDDVWDQDKMQIGCERLEEESLPSLYFCNERTINSNDKILHEPYYEPIITLESEIVCGFCPGCSMIINKALMKIVQEQDYKNIPMHDVVIAWNAFAFGKVIYDDVPHFSRRVHDNNVVASEGKKGIKKINAKVKTWINNKNSVSNFATEFKDFVLNSRRDHYLDPDILNEVISSNNVIGRFRILCDSRFTTNNRKGLRSFHIRTLLGLL